MRSRSAASGLLVLIVCSVVAPAAEGAATSCGTPDWVAAWAASPQGLATELGPSTLTGYNVVDPTPPDDGFSDETLRQVANVRFGGERLRVELSNLFGRRPVTFDNVHVGLSQRGASLVPGSARQVTFDGSPSVTIPRATSVYSDPVALPVRPFEDVVVSVYARAATGPATAHANASQTFYTAPGDQAGDESGDAFQAKGITATPATSPVTTEWFFLTGIQVVASGRARTVVAVGDSVTDGFLSSGDANRRYPDVLARRFLANPLTRDLALITQAIGGGRVLHDGFGPSTLNRLSREVLEQPHLGAVILLHGANDIGQPGGVQPAVTAQEIIAGYEEIAKRVHAHGGKIFIGTLPPTGDVTKPVPYGVYSFPEGVAKRTEVNGWIRSNRVFDGVIDFDAVLRDPANPDHLQPRYDAGDSFHPNDAGYATMAGAVPFSFFEDIVDC